MLKEAQRRTDAAHKAEGRTSAMKDEDVNADASAAFVEGHEGFQGEAGANQYRLEMDKLYREKYQVDPREWEKLKNQINSKYLNGASDAYVQGFVPRAVQIETQMDKKYADQQFIMVQDEYLTNVAEGTELAMSMVLKDNSIPDGQKAQAIRDKITMMQENGIEFYGLNRNQISHVVVKKIGTLAQRTGRPDLLAFTMVPDKDGHKMIDRPAMADQVAGYIKGAQNEQQSQVNAQIAREEKLQKEINISVDRALVVSESAGDVEDAKMLLEKYTDNLTPERLAYHWKRIHKMEDPDSWPKQSNMMDYRAYMAKAIKGEMTDIDWMEAPDSLSYNDYKEIAKIDIRAREKPADTSRNNSMVKDYRTSALKKVAPEDMFGLTTLLTPGLGADRTESLKHKFTMWQVYRDDSKGDITPEEVMKMSKQFQGEVVEEMPETVFVNDDTTSSNSGGGQKKPAGQHTKTGGVNQPKTPMTDVEAEPVLTDLDELKKRLKELKSKQ
jgi:hypothetical protein